MFFMYATAACISSWLGGIRQCLALIVLGVSYNDFNLADSSWVSRNAVNGLGFFSFTSGALEVVRAKPLDFASTEDAATIRWLWLIATVVFSTVQAQDFEDQEGDRLRERKTMPLDLGDTPARLFTAALMIVWSVVCPHFWDLNCLIRSFFFGLGLCYSARVLAFRDVISDKRTFWIWNTWMVALYSLPQLK